MRKFTQSDEVAPDVLVFTAYRRFVGLIAAAGLAPRSIRVAGRPT